jgi:hypothetical protein
MIRVVALTAVFAAGLAVAAHAGPTSYSPGTYIFTAPTTGDYTLDALGGQGGDPFGASGGLGADASGLFFLTAGEQLGIVVGGQGGSVNVSSGGGGGSFVYAIASNTLLVAGGGGGGTFVLGPSPNASTASSPLSESGGTVAGVNGTDGACCGTTTAAGTGGLSYVDTSAGDGYVSGASITLPSGGGSGLVTILAPVAAPEPASATLLLAGMTFLGWRRRHRNI